MTARQPHICSTKGCANPCRSKVRRSYCSICYALRTNKSYKKWYSKNSAQSVKNSMRWNRNNPRRYGKNMLRWRLKNVLKILFMRARQRARETGIIFKLSSWHDLPPIPKICPVLGIPIRWVVGRGHVRYTPSLDRIDSLRGYEVGNLRIISRRANTLKADATAKELILLGRDGQRLLRR